LYYNDNRYVKLVGDECVAFNDFSKYTTTDFASVDDSECSNSCLLDTTQNCGADRRASLFDRYPPDYVS